MSNLGYRVGVSLRRNLTKVILSLGGILALAAIVEVLVLPRLYAGIPIPFPRTGKPIGAALFSAAFFHILVISASIFGSALILNRFGVKTRIVPETRNDWLDVAMFFTFSVSGLGLWFSPAFLPALVIAGAYLVIVELR